MRIASPCTGICKLDQTTGWCLGCGRTGAEMADWGTQSEEARQAIWAQIPNRLDRLGVACQRLPWTTEDLRAFVLSTLQAGRGTWVMGVVGGVAEFCAPPGGSIDVETQNDVVIARTKNGALQMTIDESVRALTFDPPGGQQQQQRIVLAVKRERGFPAQSSCIADLGEDHERLLPEQDQHLFDLGLGRKNARFCVRCGPGPARDALIEATGQPLADALGNIGPKLVMESPTRVIESALGRIEVSGQIPPPDGTSPAGPHTHLLPDHLATGRALPVGMNLPRAYRPGALFYPSKPNPG